ncbi:putative solute-binding protein [Marinobacter fonticola]|uniref:putative solute-binding protein n=1 Tax=Marinobacter fonticola TaxID=2603215 RepID=UPI001D0DAA93|nr:putative solute-binding protein [Marinobacter fonticola]
MTHGKLGLGALGLWLLLGASLVQANAGEMVKRSFCVFDPIGSNGPLFNVMKSVRPTAMGWGVDLALRAYTDEKIVAEEFKAGQCDSVLLTGTRAREFNSFTGSIEALGALTSESQMRILLQTLAQPSAATLLRRDNYEVAGILPAGSIYLFIRDREIDTVGELQGKKIATLDYDNAAVTMVRHVGASVVGANSANFAGKFNNGSVDLAYAPAVAYTPLELYKGVNPGGGVYAYKLAQMTFQIIHHADRFPAGYGDKVRAHAFSRVDEAYGLIESAEKDIPQQTWMHPTEQQIQEYDRMLRDVRLSLREEGTYDARALKLMRAIRCKDDPTRAECAIAAE